LSARRLRQDQHAMAFAESSGLSISQPKVHVQASTGSTILSAIRPSAVPRVKVDEADQIRTRRSFNYSPGLTAQRVSSRNRWCWNAGHRCGDVDLHLNAGARTDTHEHFEPRFLSRCLVVAAESQKSPRLRVLAAHWSFEGGIHRMTLPCRRLRRVRDP